MLHRIRVVPEARTHDGLRRGDLEAEWRDMLICDGMSCLALELAITGTRKARHGSWPSEMGTDGKRREVRLAES